MKLWELTRLIISLCKTKQKSPFKVRKRVPDELWTEVRDIVQATGMKTIQEKEMQTRKMAVWGGLTNSCEKKRSKKQNRKGKIFPFECRVPKNSKER